MWTEKLLALHWMSSSESQFSCLLQDIPLDLLVCLTVQQPLLFSLWSNLVKSHKLSDTHDCSKM